MVSDFVIPMNIMRRPDWTAEGTSGGRNLHVSWDKSTATSMLQMLPEVHYPVQLLSHVICMSASNLSCSCFLHEMQLTCRLVHSEPLD